MNQIGRLIFLARNATFRRQLTILVGAGVLLLALLSSFAISWQSSREIRQNRQQQGQRLADSLARQVRLALLYDSSDNAADAVAGALAFPDVTRVEIHHLDGRSLSAHGSGGAPLTAVDELPPSGLSAAAFLEAEDGAAWRFVAPVRTTDSASPFEMEEKVAQILGYVRVVLSKASLDRAMFSLFALNMAIALFFAAVLLLVTSWLAQRMTQPLLHLAAAMRRAEEGESGARAELAGPRDIVNMAHAFNSMMAVLDAREQALLVSEKRFRAVIQSANDAIVTIDSAGYIVGWNRGAELTFGYTEAEASGRPLTLLIPERYRERHLAGIKRAQSGDEPRIIGKSVEVEGVRRDGSEFSMELSLAQWEVGEGHFFTGTMRDITDRRRIEAQLRDHHLQLEQLVDKRTVQLSSALEAAELADRTKDAFLANMSHELRTPLNAVIGMAGLARGLSAEPRMRDYLNKIVTSGKHLNRIINELLDLSKIAAGRMEFEIISFRLRHLIEHVDSVMAPRAAEKGLKIVKVIGSDVPDVLLGDSTRVSQILLNLLGNAIKFTQVGHIEIRVGLLAQEADRVRLNIEFEDTGIGMRAEDLDQLFKPFTQADVTVSRKYGGTGLGLAISRRLAEMMDGDISVSSIEGSGTTFKVRIWLGLGNAVDLQATDPCAEDALSVSYRDAHILVAEDQPLNREIVAALLAAVGITSRMAENGQEALAILGESGPDAFDLVLMDIQMPVMDGLTATRALRCREEFGNLPIIAMTAHTMKHEKEIGTVAGMNDHIGKPFDNASFYRTLAKWIPQGKQKTERAAQASSDQPEFLAEAPKELGTLLGVDVGKGLVRFGGNEARYRHWLAEFAATAGEILRQMRSEIAAGQFEELGNTVHAFKGRVGMLGMTVVSSAIAALETALREGSPVDDPFIELEQSIGAMCEELNRALVSIN